jgi:hypothetical protein
MSTPFGGTSGGGNYQIRGHNSETWRKLAITGNLQANFAMWVRIRAVPSLMPDPHPACPAFASIGAKALKQNLSLIGGVFDADFWVLSDAARIV